ncbi:uncharacterized protein LOC119080955 [Bradysia coprophila]|uniref:uncharacterized protein LOC119080955 n=1 Tax=Bradysia coprophila TaxID=38358 RepID=UPI00187DD0F8|nr:uncharacterized protein LOC119080955 [Bradysia coprophila]
MAILSACCWWSIRRGAFASVFYSLIYFGFSCILLIINLHDERHFLTGKVEKPVGESFLEKGTTSSTTVIFEILLVFIAGCGVVASVLLLIGLKVDRREFLIPWIFTIIAYLLIELAYFIYLLIMQFRFDTVAATIYTVELFNLCLIFYCLLCVISQYQEYRAGHGGATRHELITQAHIQYIPPSTTNFVRPHRTVKNQILCPHTNCSIIAEEPHLNGASSKHIKPQLQQSESLRKHVQFPDELNFSDSDIQTIINDTNENGHTVNSQSDNTDEYNENSEEKTSEIKNH